LAYQIEFDKRITKDLRKLDRKIAESVLDQCDSVLSKEPLTGSNIEPLKYLGLGVYRLKIFHVWCIAYKVEQSKVRIIRIAHRRDFYKGLAQRFSS
jgi:mRNA-degrading endonuclease RelE of RelBE toxin-antitoxin system